MTDVDRFLAERTQLCERQHARITPEQCAACRERDDAFCVGCAGLIPTYPLSAVTEDDGMAKKQIKCPGCKRTMTEAGRGLCGKCYAIVLKREREKQACQGEAAQVADPVPVVPVVTPPPPPPATMRQERKSGTKNKLIDLNNHLFAQLERLSDESLLAERLTEEIERSRAVGSVAKQIIDNARLALDAERAMGETIRQMPEMIAQ